MPCACDPTGHRTDVLQRLVHCLVLTHVCVSAPVIVGATTD